MTASRPHRGAPGAPAVTPVAPVAALPPPPDDEDYDAPFILSVDHPSVLRGGARVLPPAPDLAKPAGSGGGGGRRAAASAAGVGGAGAGVGAGPGVGGGAGRDRNGDGDYDAPGEYGEGEDAPTVEIGPGLRARRRPAWRWLFGALGALVSLGIGLQITLLLDALLARAAWLGWIAAGLAAIAAVAAVVIAANEVAGIARGRRVDRLRADVASARAGGDAEARAAAAALRGFYDAAPDAAQGCARYDERARHIADGVDLLDLAERELLAPLDARAVEVAARAARTTGLITAVSSITALDAAVALWSCARAIRAISAVYGGRPSLLGGARLIRRVMEHLAATGAMALGDDAMQQILGHGLAARLSRRFGEGMVNGALTARVAVAAMAVCRPAPFHALARPRVASVMRRAFAKFDRRGEKSGGKGGEKSGGRGAGRGGAAGERD